MGSNHYGSTNLFGCPNAQFADTSNRWRVCGIWLRLVLWYMFIPLLLLVTWPLIGYRKYVKQQSWDESVMFAARCLGIFLLCTAGLVLYLAYVAVALCTIVPVRALVCKLVYGHCPDSVLDPLAFDFSIK